MDCAPQSLAAAVSCYRCVPSLKSVRTFLLCEWANKVCDADALAFIAAAGLTDQTQKNAICKLVYDLKHNGSPTTFWDREILIYPFVGGNAAAHAVNLKTPGTNNLTFGADITHSALGIVGNAAANSYADTGYAESAPLSQNSSRVFWYLEVDSTLDTRYYWGSAITVGTPRSYARRNLAGAPPMFGTVNAQTGIGLFNMASTLGSWMEQRPSPANAAHFCQAYGGNPMVDDASGIASTGLSDRPMYLLAFNNGTINNPSNATLGAWSIGLPFANDAEWLAYHNIWQTYQTSLGRAH